MLIIGRFNHFKVRLYNFLECKSEINISFIHEFSENERQVSKLCHHKVLTTDSHHVIKMYKIYVSEHGLIKSECFTAIDFAAYRT
jgi:hypothetical protein